MSTERSDDPLDAIIVDGTGNLDRGLLASILKGRIEINQSGNPIYPETFYQYPDWKKIMLSILARKVSVLKELNQNLKEDMTTREISQASLVSPENVSRRLARELKDVVEKTPNGYVIPNYRLVKCKNMVEGESNER